MTGILTGFSSMTQAEAFVFHHSMDGLYPFKDKLIEYIQAGLLFEDVKVQFISNCIIEATILSYAMSSSRKMWIPQSSNGSQQSNLDIYKLINKASNKIIKKRERAKKNDYDPEYWEESRPDKNGYSKWMLEHNAEELKKV